VSEYGVGGESKSQPLSGTSKRENFMILDAVLLFDGSLSSTGVLTGSSVNSGTTFVANTQTFSANSIDVSNVAASASGKGRDIGIGDDPALEIFVVVLTTFVGAGAAMAVQLFTAADNGAGVCAQGTSTTTLNSTSTTGTLSVSTTKGFQVGGGIVFEPGTVRQEYGIITAIVANTSISVQMLGSGGALFTHTASYAVQGWTLLEQSQPIPVGELVAGNMLFPVKIPAGVQKFIALAYFVTGANMTAGQIFSGIALDKTALGPQSGAYNLMGYPSGTPTTETQYM
jgi:hypothetical protein